jgi:2-polyprenyl-6-methoxyphenol hydroxylase-like FAD-dependent oxidoreductase
MPRALVIGGSLGGLFAANLIARAGWDVDVFEHSAEELAGRGAGIVPHPEQFEALARIGVPIDDSFGVDIPLRATFDRDGKLIASLALKQVFTTWGRLYQMLRGALPAGHYHLGHSLKNIEQDVGGVTARFTNGATTRGDLLVGADGIRSGVRAQLAPDAGPRYAGYVAWRGLADENDLSPAAHRDLIPRLSFCLPPREMILGYPVAGFTNSVRPGERCYNFVWYRPADEARELPRLRTDVAGKRHDMSVPPPLLRPDIVAEMRRAAEDLLAPQFVEAVHHARQPFFQAIFDVESETMAIGRVALLGDAAFVARPHVGMGVTKAAGDAMHLADALRDSRNDVPAALERYDAERRPFGAAIVANGRELGAWLEGISTPRAQGHHTPQAVMKEIAVTPEFP